LSVGPKKKKGAITEEVLQSMLSTALALKKDGKAKFKIGKETATMERIK
jgi:hypothetical protein